MYMCVNGTCGDDYHFAGDDLSGGAYYGQAGIDAIHIIRVTSFSDADDDTERQCLPAVGRQVYCVKNDRSTRAL